MVESGLDGARRHADDLGDRGQRQADVVVQDEDRAMLRRESEEGALERVPVVDRDGRVGATRSVDRELTDPLAPAPIPRASS